MACSKEHDKHGYDERRFEGPVKRDLFCSICHEVLRIPRTCQNKEHPFCLACISEHLQLSHTCPECREHLTPETLKDPSRFLKNDLSELKIKCDYNERGCPGYVLLENLQHHVDRCGFAPVVCGNEGCGTELNKRDKETHERDLCLFRVAKCHDCKEIKASQGEIKGELTKVYAKQNEMKAKQDEMQAKQDEMQASQNEIKANVEEMKRTQAEMKADQAMFKADVKHQLGTLMDMLHQLLQGANLNNNGAQAADAPLPANKQDIIILGGWYRTGDEPVLNTAEKYNMLEKKSTLLPPMNKHRAAAACCVYNKDVIITGGYHGRRGTDSIEMLKMNQDPLQWKLSDCKLPTKLGGHVVIVHQDKLLVIGGHIEDKTSDAIHEVSLTPPYNPKVLCKMPKPRRNHSAELINGKIYILGGTTTGLAKDAMDSVFVYDLVKSKLKPCRPLPYSVCFMATATWGNMIIVVGGFNKDSQALNDVIMYDTVTGQSQILPSLIYKRNGCSAVIVNDVIVAMGGRNAEQRYLNSVECFTIGTEEWRELPGMIEKRRCACAVVISRK